MAFEILETHAHALIQCDCGDFISLSSERPAETCETCPHRYQLRVQVEQVAEETATIHEH